MPTNDDASLSGHPSNEKMLETRRPALVDQQELDWNNNGSVPGAPPVATGTVDLMVYIHALRRHWLLASTLGLTAAFVAGVAIWFLVGPQYTATSLLKIDISEQTLVGPTAAHRNTRMYQEFEVYKNTQKQQLLSRFVLTAALRKPDAARVSVVQEEVDPITWLQDELQVRFPGDSEIMEVSLSGENPNEVATLVGAVVQAYLDEVVDVNQTAKRNRLNELDRVYTDTENQLRGKRTALKRLSDQLGTGDAAALTVKQRIALEQFSQFRREHTKLQFALREQEGLLKAKQTELDNAEDMEISDFDLEMSLETDPVGKQLLMVLGGMRQRMAYDAASATAQGSSRSVERLNRDLAAIQQQFDLRKEEVREKLRMQKHAELEAEISELKTMVAVLKEQEAKAAEDVERMRAEAEKIGNSSVDLEMMRAEMEQLSEVLQTVAEEREMLKIELRSKPRVQLFQRAEVPKNPDDPTARLALAIFGMLVGMSLPVAGIAWWDVRGQRINSSAEVSKELGLTVLGSVPVIPDRAIRKLATPSRRRDHWHGRLTESIDGIAARLLRKAALQQTRTVLVTSAVSGEGKTTLATQLAMSLARAGRRTVLIDFDLRRPVVERIFGLPLEPGASDVLRGDLATKDIVQETAIDNLFVVTSGRMDQKALVSLTNGGDNILFEQLHQDFDFVVVDGSPLLPVADTRFVSQHVDAVILSILRDVSQAPKVLAACELLEAFGIRDLGVVVAGANEDPYSYDPYYRRRIPV